ncbi:MAG: hypothetical protein GEU88_12735 [Solirubrobacterales bacterium]|nr:hypothetical protein [Solirubrobacterales bacterium]
MGDPQGVTPVEDGSRGPTRSDEISRSIGSVWQRHAGHRPSEVSTEISNSVVKCELHDAIRDAKAEEPPEDESPRPDASPESAGYRHDAIAVVARITGRRVMGFIPRHDAKTSIATETFILDGVRKRF